MRPPVNPLWRFSLRTYRAEGVQEACLALQERCGADVNLLLFCGWCGRHGRLLDDADLRSAIDCVGAWQSGIVAPVRQARRALKQQLAGELAAALALPLRRRLAAIELELERAEQALLADLYSRWPAVVAAQPPQQAIAANLASYLSKLAVLPQAQDEAHVACLAEACSRGSAALAQKQGAG